MEMKNINKIYFVGIGGIGMSAIAEWFVEANFEVAGYDKTPSEITKKLESKRVKISFADKIENIPEGFKKDRKQTWIVFTPAIPKDSEILNYFQKNSYTIFKRAEILAKLSAEKNTIAVAGTHGKTSISSTLAYLLSQTSLSCNAFLGGISKNFKSNVLIQPQSELMVIEADEFDRSFLQLYPDTAIISAIDADHLDIYKNKQQLLEAFELFIKQVKEGGNVLLKKDIQINRNLNKKVEYFTYSADEKADFYAKNINIKNGKYHFDFISPFGSFENFILGVPGRYNLENAVVAIAGALLNKATFAELKTALQNYTGVKRRFDIQISSENLILIDDYAHHPAEIEACIKSVRELYPNKTITGIFQPHLFSRTRDFMDEFAKSLDLLDTVLLIPIYPAREMPIQGVTSESILNKMKLKKKYFCLYNEVADKISSLQSDIYLIMGAGDIDRLVKPIKQKLEQKILLNEKIK